MKRTTLFACLWAWLATVAQAGIVMNVPSAVVGTSGGTVSLTLNADVTGTFDLTSYEFKLGITGLNGATGLSFSGASQPSSNPFFHSPADPLYVDVGSPAGTIYCEEGLVNRTATETVADTVRNLATLNLSLAPGIRKGSTFQLTLDPAWSAFYSGISPISVPVSIGTVTVVSDYDYVGLGTSQPIPSRSVRGSATATPGSCSVNVTEAGASGANFTLSAPKLQIASSSGNSSVCPAQFRFTWQAGTPTGMTSDTIVLHNASNPDDPDSKPDHQLTVTGDVLENRAFTVSNTIAGRVMVGKSLAPQKTTLVPDSNDDVHATRVNTNPTGAATDGYATVRYLGTPLSQFNGASGQSADLQVTWSPSSARGKHHGTVPLSTAQADSSLLADGEDPSAGASVNVGLNYDVSVLANRHLTVAAVGTPTVHARALLNRPRTTTIATGTDAVLDGDDAWTRVNTVARGTASAPGNGVTVGYQGTPIGLFRDANQHTNLAVEFSKLGSYHGAINLAPTMLADGEAAEVGAVVQPATLTYNVDVLQPRTLGTVVSTMDFGNVLRGASVSGNFTVKSLNSNPDLRHTTKVTVAPGGSALGDLTVGQTKISSGGTVKVPISGVLATYNPRGNRKPNPTYATVVNGRVPVVTGESSDVHDDTAYRSFTVQYRANVGVADFGSTPTAFNSGGTILKANIAAGSQLTDLSSKVAHDGMLGWNSTPASWIKRPADLAGLYGPVGSEATIVNSTALASNATVTMQWRARLGSEAAAPKAPPSSTLPPHSWLASDVVKVGGIGANVIYAMQMSFDSRINLALDGPVNGTVAKEFEKHRLCLCEFNTMTNKWDNAGSGVGNFESLADFLGDHQGASLASLLGSWGVDPDTTTNMGIGYAWAVVAGDESGIFAVDPGCSGVTFAPEPSTIVLLSIAAGSWWAYVRRQRRGRS